MNKFEFLLNLDQYRNYKPKNVLYHDSYDIPKKEIHKIQPGYSRAPKIYKDQISLYEEYNEDVVSHAGNYKYYQKIDLPNGQSRYFYTKEEWDAYNKNAGYAQNAEKKKSDPKVKIKDTIENSFKYGPGWSQGPGTDIDKFVQSTPEFEKSKETFYKLQHNIIKEHPFFNADEAREIYANIQNEIDKCAEEFLKSYNLKRGDNVEGYENYVYDYIRFMFEQQFKKVAKNYFNYDEVINTINRDNREKESKKEWEEINKNK